MKSSIFSYLISYIPTDKKESKEDYLTQMFAWLLENVDGYSNKYIQYLCEHVTPQVEIDTDNVEVAISTQASVPSGRIDLLIRSNASINFICEHKVHSELSENQIKKYMDDSSCLGPGKYYSALVTYSTTQHTQYADVLTTWSDIYEFTEELLHLYEGEERFILKQFLEYLSENGMGKYELIQPEAMLGYWPAINLEYKLDSLFRDLVNTDFKELCPGIESLGDNYSPKYTKQRWGRLGIDMFPTWNLGIFAGVLLHNRDHALWPLDVDKGPDFVVFLESEYSRKQDKNREVYEENIHSERYLNMIRTLQANHHDYDFMPGIPDSPWRIAVLRKPLFDVLNGKYTRKDQFEAIRDAIVEAINMYIAGMK